MASEKQCETFLCKSSNAKLYRGKGLPSITTNKLSSHVPSVLKPLEVYKLTCFHAPSIFLRLIEMSSIRIPHLSWPFWLLICIGVLQHTGSHRLGWSLHPSLLQTLLCQSLKGTKPDLTGLHMCSPGIHHETLKLLPVRQYVHTAVWFGLQ